MAEQRAPRQGRRARRASRRRWPTCRSTASCSTRGATEFTGYAELESEATRLGLIVDGALGRRRAEAGDDGRARAGPHPALRRVRRPGLPTPARSSATGVRARGARRAEDRQEAVRAPRSGSPTASSPRARPCSRDGRPGLAPRRPPGALRHPHGARGAAPGARPERAAGRLATTSPGYLRLDFTWQALLRRDPQRDRGGHQPGRPARTCQVQHARTARSTRPRRWARWRCSARRTATTSGSSRSAARGRGSSAAAPTSSTPSQIGPVDDHRRSPRSAPACAGSRRSSGSEASTATWPRSARWSHELAESLKVPADELPERVAVAGRAAADGGEGARAGCGPARAGAAPARWPRRPRTSAGSRWSRPRSPGGLGGDRAAHARARRPRPARPDRPGVVALASRADGKVAFVVATQRGRPRLRGLSAGDAGARGGRRRRRPRRRQGRRGAGRRHASRTASRRRCCWSSTPSASGSPRERHADGTGRREGWPACGSGSTSARCGSGSPRATRDGMLATPAGDAGPRPARRSADLDKLARLVAEREAVEVVVGLPRSLSGKSGPAARAAREYAEALASRIAPGAGASRPTSGSPRLPPPGGSPKAGIRGRKGRQVVDRSAAVLILQGWLDAARRNS